MKKVREEFMIVTDTEILHIPVTAGELLCCRFSTIIVEFKGLVVVPEDADVGPLYQNVQLLKGDEGSGWRAVSPRGRDLNAAQ